MMMMCVNVILWKDVKCEKQREKGHHLNVNSSRGTEGLAICVESSMMEKAIKDMKISNPPGLLGVTAEMFKISD